jgi:hypothetical protein
MRCVCVCTSVYERDTETRTGQKQKQDKDKTAFVKIRRLCVGALIILSVRKGGKAGGREREVTFPGLLLTRISDDKSSSAATLL